MDNVAGQMQEALRGLERAGRELSDALVKQNAAFKDAQDRLEALLNTPFYRRMKLEAELGRPLPDWVWRVVERQRRTFGSGNGRVMRG